MWILNFLFWVIVIYYVSKIFFRYVFPWLLLRWMGKMAQRQQQQSQDFYNQQKREEGKVTVETPTNKSSSKTSKEMGEYVDFEEVK